MKLLYDVLQQLSYNDYTADKTSCQSFFAPAKRRIKNPETGKYERIDDMSYREWEKRKEKTNGVGVTVQTVGKIDISKYSLAVSQPIRTETVVLTEKQKEHIIKRRGQKFFNTYSAYFREIAEDPDYIFKDNSHKNTAIACKTITEGGENVHLVIRLAVVADDPGKENSIITAIIEGDKRYKQRLRNNIPLYKKE